MDFKERCTIAEKCLPVSEYRAQLALLHNDMIERITELETALATTERAYREQKELTDHEEKTRMDWQGMYHVAAERAEKLHGILARWKELYENMRNFAVKSGLDVTCYGPELAS